MVYDLINNPLETDDNLLELIKRYSKGTNFYNEMLYDSDEVNKDKMRKNFHNYVKYPSYKKYLKSSSITKYLEDYDLEDNKNFVAVLYKMNQSFNKMYEIGYLKDTMPSEYSIRACKDPERKVAKQNKRKEMEKEIEKLEKNVTNNDRYLTNLYIECRDNFSGGMGIMGFHVNPQNLKESSNHKEKSEIKFYVNAGEDTYKFANLFQKKCEEKGLNYYYKVVNAEESDELKRSDRMCVYSTLKDAEEFINILNQLKELNPDIKFRKPPMLSATYDNWLGIGTDYKSVDKKKSSNSIRIEIIEKSIKEVFPKVKKEDLYTYLLNNSEKLNSLRKQINTHLSQYGIDEKKFGIGCEAARILKKIELKQNNVIIDKKQDVDISGFVTYPNEVQQKKNNQIKKMLYVYNANEDIDVFLQREKNENNNILLILNSLEKGALPQEFKEKYKKQDAHKPYTYEQIYGLLQVIKTAEAISINGGRNYLEEFCNFSFMDKVLNDIRKNDSAYKKLQSNPINMRGYLTDTEEDKILIEKKISKCDNPREMLEKKFDSSVVEQDADLLKIEGCIPVLNKDSEASLTQYAFRKMGLRLNGFTINVKRWKNIFGN